MHDGPFDAHMESPVKKDKDTKSRFAKQLQQLKQIKINNNNNRTTGGCKSGKPNRKVRASESRGPVPSAPCRGREHGREMGWIIIGQKSTDQPTGNYRAPGPTP